MNSIHSKSRNKREIVKVAKFDQLMAQIREIATEALEYLPEGRSMTGALGVIGVDLAMEKYSRENSVRKQLKFIAPTKHQGRPAKDGPYRPRLILVKPQRQPESEVTA